MFVLLPLPMDGEQCYGERYGVVISFKFVPFAIDYRLPKLCSEMAFWQV